MRRIVKYILNLCAAVLLCGCYNYTGLPEREQSELVADMTLAELRGRWRGQTFEVAEPMVVGGVVTSSDAAGNFYQTFTIEDATGAAEIMAGVRDLHNTYPVGCYLCIRLEGCAVGIERGVMQIGLKSASYSHYVVDYFYSKVLLDSHVERSGEVENVAPKMVDFAGLSSEMCGRLVQLKGLRLVEESDSGANEGVQLPLTWAGYRLFEDGAGNRLYIYTSDYANYATEQVPTGVCYVTGILQYGSVSGAEGEWFILKMRSGDDCKVGVDTSL